VLLGTTRARPYHLGTLTRQISEEPYKSAIQSAWRALDVHAVLAHYLAGDAVARSVPVMAKAVVNTDDRNAVEFGLARSVGRPIGLAADIRALAQQSGNAHPRFDDDERVRWDAVDTAWVSYDTEQGGLGVGPSGPFDEEHRRNALRRYFKDGDIAGARLNWSFQPGAAHDLNELAMLADIEAESGDDAALPLIAQLRAYQPGEADTMLATLRTRQSKPEDAVEAIERAFAQFRISPWATTRYQRGALELARRVAFNPMLTRRMFDALGQPFANLAVDELRLTTRLELAMKLSQSDACLAPLLAFGHKVPWTERFLRSQRDCYQINRDPRLAAASRDLIEFLQNAPPSLPVAVAGQ
jgi:hypothetical protein